MMALQRIPSGLQKELTGASLRIQNNAGGKCMISWIATVVPSR